MNDFNQTESKRSLTLCYVAERIIRYLGSSIFVIGIISTALSIAVFSRKSLRRKSCCFYFLIMAISDGIHLLTMNLELLPFIMKIDLISMYNSTCKINIFLVYFCNHVSNVVLTLASIDRFILIDSASLSKRFCKIRRARLIVLISVVFIFLVDVHILYGYRRIEIWQNDSAVRYDCNIDRQDEFYRMFFEIFDSYVETICFVIIPFGVMSFCSFRIIFQIFETRRTIRYNSEGKYYYYTRSGNETVQQTVRRTINEKGRTRLRDKDIQLCSMLIGTTLAFIVLCLPTEINDLFNYKDTHKFCVGWLRKSVLIILQQSYYASHFYIYTLTGHVFRKNLRILIFGRRRKRSNLRKRKTTELREVFSLKTRFIERLIGRNRSYSDSCLLNRASAGSSTRRSVLVSTVHRSTVDIEEAKTFIPLKNFSSTNETH